LLLLDAQLLFYIHTYIYIYIYIYNTTRRFNSIFIYMYNFSKQTYGLHFYFQHAFGLIIYFQLWEEPNIYFQNPPGLPKISNNCPIISSFRQERSIESVSLLNWNHGCIQKIFVMRASSPFFSARTYLIRLFDTKIMHSTENLFEGNKRRNISTLFFLKFT
jgi:hypothetical protein